MNVTLRKDNYYSRWRLILHPQVSVVIPVFNGEQTIKRALDSVFAQTFPDLEVIVVDDASIDGTAAIVAQYGTDRLTFVRSSENQGAGAARNKGIAQARGRWVAFLDADDAWKPEKLARQVELLRSCSKPVGACATGYDIEKNGRRFAIFLNLMPHRFRREILFGCTISPGSTLMVERSVFDHVGYFDEKFRRLEDWDWLLRFSERHDMEFVPNPLADIYVTWKKPINGAKNNDLVIAGIRRMKKKHAARLGLHNRLQFRSSLLVEYAAALHRSGNPLGAIFYVGLALAIYPARNVGFFRSIWRATLDRLKR
jgi:glycosyltransferase involved in cell wall biosynthesis